LHHSHRRRFTAPDLIECDIQCVRYIEYLFEDPETGLVDPAAMIVESIQGEGGSFFHEMAI